MWLDVYEKRAKRARSARARAEELARAETIKQKLGEQRLKTVLGVSDE